jgi:hypothetical protein
MADGGNVVPRLTKAEHIGPDDTGDNINAKRVANYAFDGASWQRVPTSLIDVPYDYLSFTNADGNGNYQTLSFKSGGSGGTTLRTLALAFDGSNNVTSITRT